MSWLKLTSQARDKKQKHAEELIKAQQKLAEEERLILLEKLERVASQANPLLDLWKRLDCDRILKDVQKHVLRGDIGSLEIEFINGIKAATIFETPKGWVFGDKKVGRLAEALYHNGYNPEKFEGFKITRSLSATYVSSSHYNKDGDEVFDERRKKIFSITIDSQNIYCEDKTLGSHSDIQNAQMLETRIDEILANHV